MLSEVGTQDHVKHLNFFLLSGSASIDRLIIFVCLLSFFYGDFIDDGSIVAAYKQGYLFFPKSLENGIPVIVHFLTSCDLIIGGTIDMVCELIEKVISV